MQQQHKFKGKADMLWWSTQNIAVIKAQAEIRGRRYEPHETTGKAEGDFVKTTFRMKDYVYGLYELLGI